MLPITTRALKIIVLLRGSGRPSRYKYGLPCRSSTQHNLSQFHHFLFYSSHTIMFIKVNIVATVLAFAAVTLAGPTNLQCATGAPLCCQTLQDNQVAGLVDTVSSATQGTIVPEVSRTNLEGLARSFGYACTSVGSNGACAAATPAVCCQFSAFGGIAAFGCAKA
ncbi:hypothetical protein JVU11DRAFT_10257 [Chiua virens]|nr:hypothetical protein JVU11DRAFT_10257 [Chiua virens]